MTNTIIPTYTICKNKITFLSTRNKVYQKSIDVQIKRLLRKAIKDQMYLPESELVALNRYIMGKDLEIDFSNVKSRMKRHINLNFTDQATYQHIG